MYYFLYSYAGGILMAKPRNLSLAVLCLATLLLLVPVAAQAQETDDDTSEFSMDIESIRIISLDKNTVPFTALSEHVLAGETPPVIVTATITSNDVWTLQIRGSTEEWTGPYPKDVADILWQGPTGDYEPLSTAAAEVVTNQDPASDQQVPINLKIALSVSEDLPGLYTYTSVVIELVGLP